MHQTSYLSRHQREVDYLLHFCKPGNVGTHQQETMPTPRIQLAKNRYDEELIMGISKFPVKEKYFVKLKNVNKRNLQKRFPMRQYSKLLQQYRG